MYWAGCNYNINQGSNEHEPRGTATSMHACESFDRINDCLVKMNTETWEINDDITKEINQKWREMHSR
jgi:hypothetical protein